MNQPCLCGDPACGSCFPSGQVRMKCQCRPPGDREGCECGWRGKLHECDSSDIVDLDDDTSLVAPQCPLCGCPAVEEEE